MDGRVTRHAAHRSASCTPAQSMQSSRSRGPPAPGACTEHCVDSRPSRLCECLFFAFRWGGAPPHAPHASTFAAHAAVTVLVLVPPPWSHGMDKLVRWALHPGHTAIAARRQMHQRYQPTGKPRRRRYAPTRSAADEAASHRRARASLRSTLRSSSVLRPLRSSCVAGRSAAFLPSSKSRLHWHRSPRAQPVQQAVRASACARAPPVAK